MQNSHKMIHFRRLSYGAFEIDCDWLRPSDLPRVKVVKPLGLLRVFYPLYNLYSRCGNYEDLVIYVHFWQTESSRDIVAKKFSSALEPIITAAKQLRIKNDIELTFTRTEASLCVDNPVNAPPYKDSPHVDQLSEALLKTVSNLCQAG